MSCSAHPIIENIIPKPMKGKEEKKEIRSHLASYSLISSRDAQTTFHDWFSKSQGMVLVHFLL
jgi:hypothetical protein